MCQGYARYQVVSVQSSSVIATVALEGLPIVYPLPAANVTTTSSVLSAVLSSSTVTVWIATDTPTANVTVVPKDA
jgi:hypothetical protein